MGGLRSFLGSVIAVRESLRGRVTSHVIGSRSILIRSRISAYDTQLSLNVDQELLLFTDNHSNSTQPHPANQTSRLKPILVHYVAPDQSARSPQPSSTMHSYSLLFLRNVAICDPHKLADDVVVRARTVREFHFVHFYPLTFES